MIESIYFVMNVVDVTTDIFDRCEQDTPFTARYSLDGLNVLLSFKDNHGLPFEVLAKGNGPYKESEMVTYINDNSADWEASE